MTFTSGSDFRCKLPALAWGFCFWLAAVAQAGVGDPQVRTDHPWYPGELACSTFPRLFATQAEQFRRATKVTPTTDEEKALASWFWRNTHYAHGEEGAENLWGQGFTRGELRTREYWTGLFSHGFGLCGTTHSQWTAEMEYLLGHGLARGVGVKGHNAFEVWLTGGAYGLGRWALLDHDISTVIFNEDGTRLLSIAEVRQDLKRWIDRAYRPERQHGWLISGLHPDDSTAYEQCTTAEYLPGYAAAPPMVHLRRGETLRRYFEPGLTDGRTFVFWGRNYNTADIPGPERSMTWVNQPERMHGSKEGAGYKPGQARYGNAYYVYRPDFGSDAYREGAVADTPTNVVMEFRTPYIIAATPADQKKAWGIYDAGCSNGLVARGNSPCIVDVSVDHGRHWSAAVALRDGPDFTDYVKGQREYWLRFHAGARDLAAAGVTISTICQVNAAILPRLKDARTEVQFFASGRAVVSAGPTRAQAEAHVKSGGFGTPQVELELAPPRGEPTTALYAAAHVASGNPPSPATRYQIDYSVDGGKQWEPVIRDWAIPRRGQEPSDFWSQSFCYGSVGLAKPVSGPIRIRFQNDGGRNYLRAEAQLVYHVTRRDASRVTFAWTDETGEHEATHVAGAEEQRPWLIATGRGVKTRWVEFAVE